MAPQKYVIVKYAVVYACTYMYVFVFYIVYQCPKRFPIQFSCDSIFLITREKYKLKEREEIWHKIEQLAKQNPQVKIAVALLKCNNFLKLININ